MERVHVDPPPLGWIVADIKNLVFPDDERDDDDMLHHDRWLQLIDATKRRVTKRILSLVRPFCFPSGLRSVSE
jgi:hypothetical protein